MKRKWLRLPVSFTVLLFLIVAVQDGPQAQDDFVKVLVGKWEGELTLWTNRREDPNRTLIITSLDGKEGRWTASGYYGYPKQLGPVTIDVTTAGQKVNLSFITGAQSTVNLTLMQDKYLVGTLRFRSSQDERTLKLQKVQ